MATELKEIQLDLGPLRELGHSQDELLEEIDDLRSFSIGLKRLPQIIVVGDRTAGKSSVLEAIYRLPFPTRSVVCTLLAIEIRLQKSPQRKIEIVVVQEDRRTRNIQFEGEALTSDKLAERFQEALSTMCKPNTLSQEVYCVKVFGPDFPNLTLVDLPGLNLTAATPGSKHFSETLARRYLERKDALILGVISAAQPLAGQKVLDIAKQYDSLRERTIGIITKPDALEKYGDDMEYIRLAGNRNPECRLRWGWHVLKNRDKKDGGEDDFGRKTCDDRDEAEEIFLNSGIWKNIQPEAKGVHELRRKIATALRTHVAKEMCALDGHTVKRLEAERAGLQGLGIWCDGENESDKRRFLQDLALNFHALTSAATQGTSYNREKVADGSVDTAQLRCAFRDLDAAFAIVITTATVIESTLNQDGTYGHDAHLNAMTPTVESWIRKFGDAGSSDVVNSQAQFEDQIFKWHDVATRYIALAIDVAAGFILKSLLAVSWSNQRFVSAIKEEFVSKFIENKGVELRNQLTTLAQSYRGNSDEYDQRRHRQRTTWSCFHCEPQAQSQLTWHQPQVSNQHSPTNEPPEQYNYNVESTELVAFHKVLAEQFTETVIGLLVHQCLIREIPNVLGPLADPGLDSSVVMRLTQIPQDVSKKRKLHIDFIQRW
ncbi:dynamin family protein [Pochonia chlamydosporia 170]|uniref:Dynamin family protein n=1 Tax=Pochonia chlamydosporia 170 TaxID=1380566 RepID=A0A219AP34_METCM|nr:dynamin family protein [Pochonia chlamydosporia 170]OWT42586.1 dynamin family protein [Pochonia chlamydosporia 170]